jgi:hypothetical protein
MTMSGSDDTALRRKPDGVMLALRLEDWLCRIWT